MVRSRNCARNHRDALPVSRLIPRRIIVSTFLRSFLIQGSWNYHTMLGSGFAFSMLPTLRRVFGSNGAALDEAVARHQEHFNAHPYMANLALGAAMRLEAEGSDADTVRRLKAAVRSPLGGLGDALVWAAWLPGVAVGALALYWLGAPAGVVVTAFLVTYNVGHLGLRAWCLSAGLRAGRELGGVLVKADLSRWTARLRPVVVGLLGVMVGGVVGADGGLAESGLPWVFLAGAGFVAGLVGGHKAWRPAAALTVAAIAAVASLGVLR